MFKNLGLEVRSPLPGAHFRNPQFLPTAVAFPYFEGSTFLVRNRKAPEGWYVPSQVPVARGESLYNAAVYGTCGDELGIRPSDIDHARIRYLGTGVASVPLASLTEGGPTHKLLHFVAVPLHRFELNPNPSEVVSTDVVDSWRSWKEASALVAVFSLEKFLAERAALISMIRHGELPWSDFMN